MQREMDARRLFVQHMFAPSSSSSSSSSSATTADMGDDIISDEIEVVDSNEKIKKRKRMRRESSSNNETVSMGKDAAIFVNYGRDYFNASSIYADEMQKRNWVWNKKREATEMKRAKKCIYLTSESRDDLSDEYYSASPYFVQRNDINFNAITKMKFDHDDILLATASRSGSICFYNTNELAAVKRYQKYSKDPALNEGIHVKPIFKIQTSNRDGKLNVVEDISWNPYDEQQIACAFSPYQASISLFNLESCRNAEPFMSFSSASDGLSFMRAEAMGCSSVQFLLGNENKGMISAGTFGGSIRLWDIRNRPNAVVWETKKTGSAVVSVFTNKMDSVQKNAIFAANEKGDISAYDSRKVTTGTFGTASSPTTTWSENILSILEKCHKISSKSSLKSITHNPENETILCFQCSNGIIGVFDLLTRRITNIHSPLPNNEEEAIQPSPAGTGMRYDPTTFGFGYATDYRLGRAANGLGSLHAHPISVSKQGVTVDISTSLHLVADFDHNSVKIVDLTSTSDYQVRSIDFHNSRVTPYCIVKHQRSDSIMVSDKKVGIIQVI